MSIIKRHWQKSWSLFLTIPLVLVAGIYFWYTYQYLPLDNKTTFYWFHASLYYLPLGIACCLVPTMFLGFFLLLFLSMVEDRPDIRVALALLLLIPVFILAGGTALLTILGSRDFRDTARLDGQVYRLDSEWKIGVGGASRGILFLWECDSLGLFCKIVHREKFGPTIHEGDFQAIHARLRADSKRHTISVVIDDAVVYTHPTE